MSESTKKKKKKVEAPYVTNREYAETAPHFRLGCSLAGGIDPETGEPRGIEPTKRQAGKFRRRQGLAYKALLAHGTKWPIRDFVRSLITGESDS